MRIIAVDDNELALEELVISIEKARPSDEVFGFGKPSELLAFAEKNDCHIAFLDIEMRGMSGLELAVALKKIKPTINVIFVTAYPKYKGDALDLRVSGYVMKPVTTEAVEREIENLRHPVDKRMNARFYVQTFGNFEVFTYGKPLEFCGARSKEAFAYLVDRQGAAVSTAELAAVLWEDRPFDRSIASQTRKAVSGIMKTLRENNVSDVIIKGWNSLRIDKSKIVCDMFDLFNADAPTINAFLGEYMKNYSWAELTTGAISQKTNIT